MNENYVVKLKLKQDQIKNFCLKQKEMPVRKSRPLETSNALIQQNAAFKEYIPLNVRKFRMEEVSIDTIGGAPLVLKVWVSDEKSKVVNKKKPKEPVMLECDICKRSFDERRKLLIHKKCHNRQNKPLEPSSEIKTDTEIR